MCLCVSLCVCVQSKRLDRLMNIQHKASKILKELECEPSGELAKVHDNSAIKTYVFSTENMKKLEDCFMEVRTFSTIII